MIIEKLSYILDNKGVSNFKIFSDDLYSIRDIESVYDYNKWWFSKKDIISFYVKYY